MLNQDFKCLRLLPTPPHLISLSNISLWSDVKYVATGDMWVVSPITSFGTSFSQQNKKKETTRHAIFLSNHFTIRPFSHVDLFSRRWQFIISSILKFLSAFFCGIFISVWDKCQANKFVICANCYDNRWI